MQLRVSPTGRTFEKDGRPFFWLGDTAWLLFQKLTEEEILTYLDNRQEKGFNVLQCTLVHTDEYANRAGRRALLDDDFAKPDPDESFDAYWPMVRRIAKAAAERDMVLALLPSWGHFVPSGRLAGNKIDVYTDFLASRFSDLDNIIWLVGGDVRGSDAHDDFNRLGSALKAQCPGHLVGFHPFGRTSSSYWFSQAPWLDFNLFQSGHRRYDQVKMNQWDDKVNAETFVGEDNYRYVLHDRALAPPKPVLDGEPSYEWILQGLHDPSQPYWQTKDVRRYAYWSVLAGAAGFTYGSNGVMQFYCGSEKGNFGVFETWREAIHDPGSMQMAHLKRLMEDMAFASGTPAQGRLVGNTGKCYEYNLALETDRGMLVYSYTGHPFAVCMDGLGKTRAYWFDPVSGVRSYFGAPQAQGTVTFVPPDRRQDQNDWVLVLEKTEGTR